MRNRKYHTGLPILFAKPIHLNYNCCTPYLHSRNKLLQVWHRRQEPDGVAVLVGRVAEVGQAEVNPGHELAALVEMVGSPVLEVRSVKAIIWSVVNCQDVLKQIFLFFWGGGAKRFLHITLSVCPYTYLCPT